MVSGWPFPASPSDSSFGGQVRVTSQASQIGWRENLWISNLARRYQIQAVIGPGRLQHKWSGEFHYHQVSHGRTCQLEVWHFSSDVILRPLFFMILTAVSSCLEYHFPRFLIVVDVWSSTVITCVARQNSSRLAIFTNVTVQYSWMSTITWQWSN